MERGSWLLTDGSPNGGEPLPHCLGNWASEHDMADGGKLVLTSGLGAEMGLWRASADVPEERSDKEFAVQQTPGDDAARSV